MDDEVEMRRLWGEIEKELKDQGVLGASRVI